MSPSGVTQVLSYLPKVVDPNLLVGTETHDDAGVYRISPDLALVQTVDFFPPVVDDPFVFGQIAATNALSDVYAMGGTPLTALNLLCYPDDQLSPDWMGQILAGGAERCREARCTIVGGHTIRDTGIKFGLSVTGTIHPDRILTNATARPGDRLVLTKPLGTGFVATAAKKNICPPDLLAAATASMIALNRPGRDAMFEARASAATDVTGFGLAGHAYEMASGSHATLAIQLRQLPLLPGLDRLPLDKVKTRASKSNREYTLAHSRIAPDADPFLLEVFYDAQTSGGLLIACPEERMSTLLAALKTHGALTAAVIGEVRPPGDAALILTN